MKRQVESNLIVAANSHYAGFGLGTAIMFRTMLDLPEVTWKDEQDAPSTHLRNQSN